MQRWISECRDGFQSAAARVQVQLCSLQSGIYRVHSYGHHVTSQSYELQEKHFTKASETILSYSSLVDIQDSEDEQCSEKLSQTAQVQSVKGNGSILWEKRCLLDLTDPFPDLAVASPGARSDSLTEKTKGNWIFQPVPNMPYPPIIENKLP